MRRYFLFAAVLVQIGAAVAIVWAQEPRTAEEFYARARQKMRTLPRTQKDVEALQLEITADLERAVKLAPNNPAYINDWAEQLVSGHSPRAKAELDRLIRRKPSVELYGLRADWYIEQNQRPLAVTDLTNAIKLDPKSPFLYSERAFEYNLLGQYEKALADYNRAISLRPYDADLYIHRGENYELMFRSSDAEADYARAIKLDPKVGYDKRANYYWIRNEYAKAIADITKVIELDPKWNSALSLRSFMYADAKEYDKAIADVSVLIERVPQKDNYYDLRANLYRMVGKRELAAKDEATAAELRKKE